jgi:hypothetical protein
MRPVGIAVTAVELRIRRIRVADREHRTGLVLETIAAAQRVVAVEIQCAAAPAEREELGIRDDARRTEHRVHER